MIHTETFAPPCSPNTELLCVNALISIANTKIGQKQSLYDFGAIYYDVNTVYMNSLDMRPRFCSHMGFSVAGEVQPKESTWQVSLNKSKQGLTSNCVDISGWYMIVNFGRIYDLTVIEY